MKDRVLLVLIALPFAGLGWVIWHYFGGDAPWVISTVLLISVIADNARLRRRLRRKHNHDI